MSEQLTAAQREAVEHLGTVAGDGWSGLRQDPRDYSQDFPAA